MPDEIMFTGDSQLKGRNGYTSLGKADSFVSSGGTFEPMRYIEFHSKRSRGSAGTALLYLNREDFQRFKEWIAGLEFDDTRSEREKEIGSIAFAEEQARRTTHMLQCKRVGWCALPNGHEDMCTC